MFDSNISFSYICETVFSNTGREWKQRLNSHNDIFQIVHTFRSFQPRFFPFSFIISLRRMYNLSRHTLWVLAFFQPGGSPGSVQGQTGASQCGRIANALYIVEQECDSNSSLFWSSFIVASRSLVICHEPKMVLFVPHCRLPDIQDFRVIFTSFLCVFSPSRQRQLADHMPNVLQDFADV